MQSVLAYVLICDLSVRSLNLQIETGMRNHEVVPAQLVAGVAGLPHGHCHKILRELCRYKLIHFEHRKSKPGCSSS